MNCRIRTPRQKRHLQDDIPFQSIQSVRELHMRFANSILKLPSLQYAISTLNAAYDQIVVLVSCYVCSLTHLHLHWIILPVAERHTFYCACIGLSTSASRPRCVGQVRRFAGFSRVVIFWCPIYIIGWVTDCEEIMFFAHTLFLNFGCVVSISIKMPRSTVTPLLWQPSQPISYMGTDKTRAVKS